MVELADATGTMVNTYSYDIWGNPMTTIAVPHHDPSQRDAQNPYLINISEVNMDKRIIEIINNWNPIEIYPLLPDEYLTETQSIIKNSAKSKTVVLLAEEIFNVFKQSFGKEFSKSIEECQVIAEKIIQI